MNIADLVEADAVDVELDQELNVRGPVCLQARPASATVISIKNKQQ